MKWTILLLAVLLLQPLTAWAEQPTKVVLLQNEFIQLLEKVDTLAEEQKLWVQQSAAYQEAIEARDRIIAEQTRMVTNMEDQQKKAQELEALYQQQIAALNIIIEQLEIEQPDNRVWWGVGGLVVGLIIGAIVF